MGAEPQAPPPSQQQGTTVVGQQIHSGTYANVGHTGAPPYGQSYAHVAYSPQQPYVAGQHIAVVQPYSPYPAHAVFFNRPSPQFPIVYRMSIINLISGVLMIIVGFFEGNLWGLFAGVAFTTSASIIVCKCCGISYRAALGALGCNAFATLCSFASWVLFCYLLAHPDSLNPRPSKAGLVIGMLFWLASFLLTASTNHYLWRCAKMLQDPLFDQNARAMQENRGARDHQQQLQQEQQAPGTERRETNQMGATQWNAV